VAGVIALALLAPGAFAAAPANDEFSAAEALAPGLPVSATGTNVEATKEGGEPDHALTSAGHSVWYSWQAPSTAVVTVDTCGSNFDTVVGVYTGATVGGLTEVASDAFGGGPNCTSSRQAEVAFKATEGTTYWIAVDGYEEEFEEEEFETDPEGAVKLAISLTVPPANDDFADAESLNGAFAFAEAGNWGATKEAGEPDHAGDKGGASTWYSWTAPASGPVLGFACGTFESLFAVYTGGSVNSLTPVSSTRALRGRCEEFEFVASVGVTYRVAIDGLFSASSAAAQMGRYFFELWMPPPPPTPPLNDNFRSAQQLPSSPSVLFSESTRGATRQVGDPRPAGIEEPGATVWFNWTAPGAGTVSLDTCGSNFDTFLGVYTGTALGALTQVAVNDNSPGPNCPRGARSELTFTASAGAIYRFMVGGPEFDQGDLTLRLSEVLSAPPVAARDTKAPKTIPGKRIVKGRARKATFTFRAGEPGAKFRCKLDSQPFKACSSPKTYRKLKPGRHTFEVVAVDAAGNVDRSPAVAHFLIPQPSKRKR
jgi:hypothetical protein